MSNSPLTPEEQFQCLNLLDMLSDFLTASEKETFTRADLLIALDSLRSNPEMFDPECVIAQQEVTRDIV